MVQNNNAAQREKVCRLLTANQDIRRILEKALKLEEEGPAKYPGHPEYYIGWEWQDIAVNPQKLKVLVEEQLLEIPYHSSSSNHYKVKDPELVREALKAIVETPVEESCLPENLFGDIVGHDEVKYWLNKSLKAAEPVHIILVGPPASGKSLFLENLGTLPGAQYALGGSSSKAGIAEFLLNFRPRYLIIDELEKADRDDLSVLLSLMSSGIVARLKKGMREVQKMHVTVYAGANRTEHLPPELISRFIRFNFETYTLAQFIEVAVTVITSLGKDPDLARYIAERVALRTRDVRQAISLSKLIDTKDELDRYSASWFEGQPQEGEGTPPL